MDVRRPACREVSSDERAARAIGRGTEHVVRAGASHAHAPQRRADRVRLDNLGAGADRWNG